MRLVSPGSPLGPLFLCLFLASTPAAVFSAFALGFDRALCAIINQYLFSAAMIGLYVAPLLSPLAADCVGARARLERATMNWVVWLSVFTQVVFQVPHNVFTRQLHAARGTVVEWPFYAYGLSDARWASYDGGRGLPFVVQLINYNDALLGAAVGCALAWRTWAGGAGGAGVAPRSLFVLLVVFRDATLFRETVEYMLDHHRSGYAHTVSDPALRPHAIACLWMVNIVWLVAPILTVAWALHQIEDIALAVSGGDAMPSAAAHRDQRAVVKKRA